jgi:hypothetical protein
MSFFELLRRFLEYFEMKFPDLPGLLKRGVYMVNAFWEIVSLILLLPILYLLPIGITARGKLALASSAFLFALIAGWAKETLPLWQTTLILLLLISCVSYLMDRRLRFLFYRVKDRPQKGFSDPEYGFEKNIGKVGEDINLQSPASYIKEVAVAPQVFSSIEAQLNSRYSENREQEPSLVQPPSDPINENKEMTNYELEEKPLWFGRNNNEMVQNPFLAELEELEELQFLDLKEERNDSFPNSTESTSLEDEMNVLIPFDSLVENVRKEDSFSLEEEYLSELIEVSAKQ